MLNNICDCTNFVIMDKIIINKSILTACFKSYLGKRLRVSYWTVETISTNQIYDLKIMIIVW